MRNSLFQLLVLISFTAFVGCQKDVELQTTLKSTSTILGSSKTFQLVISPDTIGCTYDSENSLIASVSTSGLITANKIGVTNIIVKNNKKGFNAKCQVTVSPQHFMFKEPYLVFGAAKSAIKSYEARALSIENETLLAYNGENPLVYMVAYSIENSIYKVSLCLIPNAYSSLLGDFLAERYVYVTSDISNNSFSMVSPDKKTLVIVKVYSTTYTYVGYATSGIAAQNAESQKTNSELIKRIDSVKTEINAFHVKRMSNK